MGVRALSPPILAARPVPACSHRSLSSQPAAHLTPLPPLHAGCFSCCGKDEIAEKKSEIAALRRAMASLSPEAAWSRDVILVAVQKAEQELNSLRK